MGGALLHNGDDEAPGLGVTANAILLLGFMYGRFAADDVYEPVSADPETACLLIRHRISGNVHRVSIVQASGTEFAPVTG